ncbi:MAG: 3-dehydroquinate synthase [Saprospiraceae bacterium]|nr:3-dehydroquinate synthase [Saprospiraceae bacterium]
MVFTFALPDYPILLGPLADTLPAWLAGRRYSNVLVFTDQNTQTHCLPRLSPFLPAAPGQVAIEPGERCKTLDTCQQLWQSMFAAQLDRQALVINLGGGVLGDMGGFCAATYKRGVDFVQVPTTLLAMTDAAIGGKLGIDFQGLKNAVGLFKNPAAVFVDPAFLDTLPPRELRSGFAEVLKHARIGDPDLWANILARAQAQPAGQVPVAASDWLEVLRASIAVKVRVVTEDPLEKGIRALLNFGHTIGHAVESYFLESDAPLTHGEAVAMGMICEALPAENGRGGHDTAMEQLILSCYGHRPIPEQAFPQLWALMGQDKKNASGAVRMAVPDAEPFSMRLLELTRPDMERRLRYYNRLV